MSALSSILSRYPIKNQILIGFMPVLVILMFLTMLSSQNNQKFNQRFHDLSIIQEDIQLFLKIENNFVELQRNAIVYSYIGYEGVLRKINALQDKLEKKLAEAKNNLGNYEGARERFQRLINHYNAFKQAFQEAVKKRKLIQQIKEEQLTPLNQKLNDEATELHQHYIDSDKIKAAYITLDIQKKLSQISFNTTSFEKSPDSMLIRETYEIIEETEVSVNQLQTLTPPQYQDHIGTIIQLLDDYKDQLKEVTIHNRVYLYLTNVVLAGKAAEIDKLTSELDEIILSRANALRLQISQKSHEDERTYYILSILAGIVGLISVMLVTNGIAQPVRSMTKALSKLANGESDTAIPGIERRDEVGEMADSANAFKDMAKFLEQQTQELEEFAYRTSHDLRSPLVSSIGLIKIAVKSIEDNKSDRAVDCLSHVQQSLEDLEVLVKDILALTATKNAEQLVDEVNIQLLTDKALRKFSHMENFDRLNITKNITLQHHILIEASRLNVVIENLISNAIKYQDTSKENSQITISATFDENGLTYSVKDNGICIPKEKQSDLFTMFKRFHPNVSFGSGLGMYMVQKSAEILNGSITYNDLTDGSEFVLKVPAQKVE